MRIFAPSTRKNLLPWACYLLILLLSTLLAPSPLVTSLDQRLLDANFRLEQRYFPLAARNDPVVVGMNERFFDEMSEPMSVSHAYLAQFFEAMNIAHPAAIGLDVTLPEKRFDNLQLKNAPDQDMHQTLLSGLLQTVQQTPVMVGKQWDDQKSKFKDIHTDYKSALAKQGSAERFHVSALICPDGDGKIRHYPGSDCQPDQNDISLAGEVGAAAGAREAWSGLINYRVGRPFSYIPMQDVLRDLREHKDAHLQQVFGGKVVFLGTVLDDVDVVDVAMPIADWLPGKQRVPGVLVHAQLVRNMLNNGFVQPVAKWFLLPLALLFSLFWFGEEFRSKTICLGLASAVLIALSSYFLLHSIWLPPGAPLLTGLVALLGSAAYQSWKNYEDKRRLTSVFSGYVSPNIMTRIVSGELDATRSGKRVQVCVLFSDIRNFTTMCEHLAPEEVVALLNRYFDHMVAVVHRHSGTVDKFIGDGLMAFFGDPNPLACPEQNGLDAARDMLVALETFNRELQSQGKATMQIGIGVHSGTVVVGQVGSSERHDYTAIGDTVNIAARLESLCKETGYPIVCSEAVVQAIADSKDLQSLGEKAIKGRSALAVYGWRPAD